MELVPNPKTGPRCGVAKRPHGAHLEEGTSSQPRGWRRRVEESADVDLLSFFSLEREEQS